MPSALEEARSRRIQLQYLIRAKQKELAEAKRDNKNLAEANKLRYAHLDELRERRVTLQRFVKRTTIEGWLIGALYFIGFSFYLLQRWGDLPYWPFTATCSLAVGLFFWVLGGLCGTANATDSGTRLTLSMTGRSVL